MVLTSIYLSRILNTKIYSMDDKTNGVLTDLAVTVGSKNPQVAAAKVKVKGKTKYYDWNNITVQKQKGQYKLTCSDMKEISIDKYMLLKKYVLDKQLIDVNGRKVVRANDVRLVVLGSGFFVVAVDIGMEGILRRLGLAKPLKKMGFTIPSKLMLWNDVETVYTSKDIMLSTTYNKLNTLHPSDLADIIEDFDPRTGMIIFSSFDNAKAADVLEELEEDAQVSVLKNLSTDKAADILEEMPADEVADILDGIDRDKAEELLKNMEKEASDEVRELMEYEDEDIGSLMNTDFISFKYNVTVGEVISSLRNTKPEEEQIYYIYVTDDDDKLLGTLTLRDVILADSHVILQDIMNKDFIYMLDTDKLDKLFKVISKYNLFAMPIVDEEMIVVGNVIVTDVIYELIKGKRR